MDTIVTDTKECRRCYATVASRSGDLLGRCVCYDKSKDRQVADRNKKYPCLQDEIRRSIETPPAPEVVDEVLETADMSLALEEAPDAVSDRFTPSAYLGDQGGGPDRTPGFAPMVRPPLGWDKVVTEEGDIFAEETAVQFMQGLLADAEVRVRTPLSKPGYEALAGILVDAFDFAAWGKGHERHGNDGLPWSKQRIFTLTEEYGLGFPLGQAGKKLGESQRMEPEAAERELLGAISYIAAAIHKLRQT